MSTLRDVFSGLTDHHRLQRSLPFCLLLNRCRIIISPIVTMFVTINIFFLNFIGVTFESDGQPLEDLLLKVRSTVKDA